MEYTITGLNLIKKIRTILEQSPRGNHWLAEFWKPKKVELNEKDKKNEFALELLGKKILSMIECVQISKQLKQNKK